ncbi:Pentatricopeptide repeat [Trema orientale]|uniref:Pentatricopeptide repeat n=1 Tax=Trema orientale TaxID=63057 RepID=A0A2P5BK73_TREOI|nr:Pentatricopeptide repeat [Trema orientale]
MGHSIGLGLGEKGPAFALLWGSNIIAFSAEEIPCISAVVVALLSEVLFLEAPQSATLLKEMKDGIDVVRRKVQALTAKNFKVMDSLRKGDLSRACNLFDQMPLKNTITTNLIISGYVKQSDIYIARHLFDTMLQRTVVTWTILVGGYSHRNEFSEGFKVFAEMQRLGMQPDYVTFATLI